MTLSRQEIKNILRLYKNIGFPASFSSASKFRRALKDHENIKVGLRELEDILNNDLSTQMQKVKPRNPKMRHVTSEGVTIQGLCDIVYINLSIPLTLAEKKNKVLKKTPKPIKYAFLVAIDVLSR